MSSLMQYLMQQTQEFNQRVDEVQESVTNLEDKIAVLEYNIVKELRLLRQELDRLYIEEDNNEDPEQT
jgi:peptidoglycan hydrolase CwlO-like protein